MRKDIYVDGNKKKAGTVLLMSGKIDFKRKIVIKDKE